jgi:hypothetical protein
MGSTGAAEPQAAIDVAGVDDVPAVKHTPDVTFHAPGGVADSENPSPSNVVPVWTSAACGARTAAARATVSGARGCLGASGAVGVTPSPGLACISNADAPVGTKLASKALPATTDKSAPSARGAGNNDIPMLGLITKKQKQKDAPHRARPER